jgi:hypothetical protein
MSRHIKRAAWAGAGAGFISAACIGLVAFWGAIVTGGPWYFPFELVGWSGNGSTVHVGAGLQSPTVLVSAIVQLGTGMCWGAVFGGLFGPFIEEMTLKDGALLGAFFGVVAWIIDLTVLMPLGDPKAPIAIPFWLDVLLHVAYGTALGAIWVSHYRVRRL